MDIVQNVATLLQEHLGKELDELARECKVVRREREFTGQSLLLMIVATLMHKPDATWTDFPLTAAQLNVHVTRTAVEKRFAAEQPLVDFLRSALERALQKVVVGNPSSAQLLQRFTAVLVGDASAITLPDELAELFPGCGGTVGTSRAALKIQVLWDLKTGQLVRLEIEPGRASDARSLIAVTKADPGALLVYDLGYFDLSRFATLNAQQAKFISRLQYGVQVYDIEGMPLNLLAYLHERATGVLDSEVVLGKSEQFRCRLIAIRVPEEIANRRRQRARETAQRKGRTPSEEYLELLGWSLFITNCTGEALTWKEVVVLYRTRWQIELLFKLWKSHNQLARSRPGVGERGSGDIVRETAGSRAATLDTGGDSGVSRELQHVQGSAGAAGNGEGALAVPGGPDQGGARTAQAGRSDREPREQVEPQEGSWLCPTHR